MEQEQNTDIDQRQQKNNEIYWKIRTMRTVNAEINTKNFLSKFRKQKCTVINKYQEINNMQGEV